MFCFKCGVEIKHDNRMHCCEWCGEHIFGTKDANEGGEIVSNWLQYGLIATTVVASKRGKLMSNYTIEKLYYDSIYYHQTKYPIWETFNDKGKIGEYAIEYWLKGLYSQVGLSQPWRIMYNVIIPEPNGSFQEIDAILIARRFIFVIECKNRSGKMYIDRFSSHDCLIEAGGNRYQAYSPIKQNEQHVTALRDLLKRNNLFDKTRTVNLVITAAHMQYTVGNLADDYDKLTMYPTSIANYMEAQTMIERAIRQGEGVLTGDERDDIVASKVYSLLCSYNNISNNEKSLYMREREARKDEFEKHQWCYYYYPDENYIVRENGVYWQWRSGSIWVPLTLKQEIEIAQDQDHLLLSSPIEIVKAIQAIDNHQVYIPMERNHIVSYQFNDET